MTNNNENKQIDGCDNYVLPNMISYGIYGNYCLTFKANKAIKFLKPDDPIGGLQKIGFYFYENTTTAEVNTLGIASLAIQLTPPDFNSLTHPVQADKATLSEFKLQLNFIAGMVNYAAVVKFKTSTYRSILPGDVSAIFGFRPNYYATSTIENFINYFPFNNNPYNIPVGTTGYFSVAAGSFIQEQTTEERTNTILSAIAAAGGTFGVMGGTIVFLFGDFHLSPWGFAHKFHKFTQKSVAFFEHKSYQNRKLKFLRINDEDEGILKNEFEKIRNAIYYHLLNLNDATKMYKQDQGFLENGFNRFKSKIYSWLLDVAYIEKMYKAYENDKGYLTFSNKNEEDLLNMNEEDQRLLNDEFNKIRHVVEFYLFDNSKDPKKFAAYKYELKLKFSNMDEVDEKLLNDEFRKIRKIIDNHLLGTPNIEEIFG